jgi:hypothetical protein
MKDHSTDHRPELIADVRTFADLLDQMPDLPAPKYVDVLVFPDEEFDESARAEIDRISAIRGAPVEDDAGHYRTTKTMGRVTYRAVAIATDARQQWDAHRSYEDAAASTADSLDDVLGRSCGCGARIDDGSASCRKCTARSRWQRRKAPRPSKRRAAGDESCS